MTTKVSSNPQYPKTKEEWQEWIRDKIGIDKEEGDNLHENETFPTDKLVEVWQNHFTEEDGYHPDFIPALTRNKRGFLEWVYGAGSEPLWNLDDETQ